MGIFYKRAMSRHELQEESALVTQSQFDEDTTLIVDGQEYGGSITASGDILNEAF